VVPAVIDEATDARQDGIGAALSRRCECSLCECEGKKHFNHDTFFAREGQAYVKLSIAEFRRKLKTGLISGGPQTVVVKEEVFKTSTSLLIKDKFSM
jgi:hypothetical protein